MTKHTEILLGRAAVWTIALMRLRKTHLHAFLKKLRVLSGVCVQRDFELSIHDFTYAGLL